MLVECKRILLADDDPGLLEVEESFLSRPGLEIRRASSGNEAIAAIRDGLVPDVILSDLNMPDGTGIDLLRFVRGNRATSDTPMVILSGSIRQEEIDTAHELGCTAFLPKPVSCLQLLDKVAECLEVTVRSACRFEVDLPGTVDLEANRFHAVTKDISHNGICFETQARLDVGGEYRLQLIPPPSAGPDSFDIVLSVVRATSRKENDKSLFCYGADIVAVSGRWNEMLGLLSVEASA